MRKAVIYVVTLRLWGESGYITAVFINGLGSAEGRWGEAEMDQRELYHFWVMSLWFRCALFEEASLIHFGPESRCQPGCGPVWESNLGRIEHVTCDNVHPAWEPEDHIDNVRFIRPRRGSNYEQPRSARAEIGQRLFFLSEWFNSCFSCLYFSLRFNIIRPKLFVLLCLFVSFWISGHAHWINKGLLVLSQPYLIRLYRGAVSQS